MTKTFNHWERMSHEELIKSYLKPYADRARKEGHFVQAHALDEVIDRLNKPQEIGLE